MTITQSYGSCNTYSRYELTVEEGAHGALDIAAIIDGIDFWEIVEGGRA